MIEINNETYKLPESNYIKNRGLKKQIILCNTFNNNMRHYVGWLHRYHGYFNKTAPFTISSTGIIYKHFEPEYQSNFFDNIELNKKNIIILIENDGWLIKNINKNCFINWTNDIYREPSTIFEKKWRGYDYWCNYNEKQLESTIKLVKYLCLEFNLPMTVVNHNTYIDNFEDLSGVLYRSNINKNSTDLNPSWEFEIFKDKLEKKIN